jgi:hypothetical protein
MLRTVSFALLFLAVTSIFRITDAISSSELIGKEIIEKYHLHPKGTPTIQEESLSHLLTLPWSFYQLASKRAGLDLSSYAGQSVAIVRYDLVEQYYQTTRFGTERYDLSLWLVAKGPVVVGAFATIRSAHGPIPGVYAISDPNIKLPDDVK